MQDLTFKEWVSTWTVFNWITLVAFIFGSISVTNAILSLRSRYLNWRGMKNQKQFIKRLGELEQLVQLIGRYRRESIAFYPKVIHDALAIFLFFLMSLLINMFTVIISVTRLPEMTYGLVILVSLVFLWLAIMLTIKLKRLVKYVLRPSILANEIIDFIETGDRKKLLPEGSGISMYETLVNNEMLSGLQGVRLKLIVGNPPTPPVSES